MKRTPTAIWLALSLTTWALPACGGDSEAEAEVPDLGATTSVTLEGGDEGGELIVGEPSAAAQHGGVTLSVGPHPVELVATQEGEVTVYATGEEPPLPGQTQVVVRVPADDGAVHPVTLIWDPGASAYRGRLYSVRPMPGPVQVELTVGSDPYVGRSPRYVLHGAHPEVEVEGPARPTVVVERPARPEVRVQGPTVVVERPTPPPPPTLVVERPDPRPTVVVEHRAPRGNVVVQPRRGRSRAGRVRVPARRGRGRVRVR